MADIPVIESDKPVGFLSFVVEAVLSNPRTQAQIGTAVRTVLVAFGSSWAATHGDALNLLAGGLLAVMAFVWGCYQKWRVDRKIRRLAEGGAR
jgi:hypothetical protein